MLLTIGWATTLLAMKRRWLRQRQAWQWWQAQQILQSHHNAESIRDGLLQQTFAFRRYLETMGAPAETVETADTAAMPGRTIPPEAEQTQQWIERVHTFHQSLEGLSNELSAPFVADSLPLALQFTLKSWQQAHAPSAKECHPAQLSIKVPPDWPPSSTAQNQLILSIAIELLTLLQPNNVPGNQLHITLSHEETLNTLIFQLSNDAGQPLPNLSGLAEIQHLKEIFHSLAAGQLDISQKDLSLIARLRWRS